MSYSQLIVFKGNEAEHTKTYRNSHGTGSFVWDKLQDKYVNLIFPNVHYPDHPPLGMLGGWEKTWKWVQDNPTKMRPWEHMVLSWTMDHALVRGPNLETLTKALEIFEEAHGMPERVCHLAAIARDIRELGPNVSVGIYLTSLSDDHWLVRNLENPSEEPRPYNLSIDTKHWYVGE